MTFIELVNKLRQEASVSGSAVPSVLNQRGEYLRLINWINDAYLEIQLEYMDWMFLRKSGSFNTIIGVNIVTPPADLNGWDMERFYDGDNNICAQEYSSHIPSSSTGSVSTITIKDDNSLILSSTPDSIQTISYDYFRVPHTLINDADTPLIPAAYHQVIIGRALILAGNYDDAQELIRQGSEIYRKAIVQLRNNQIADKRGYYGQGNPRDIVIAVQ